MVRLYTKVAILLAVVAIHGATQATAQECGPSDGSITIAGSTTVEPISQAWGAAYTEKCGVPVKTEGGGSSLGAARVCGNGTYVDIGDMSREWNVAEATTDFSGYKYQCVTGNTALKVIQIEVAIDGLSVTMQGGGAGATCVQSLGGLTVDQLRWIFSSYTVAQLEATKWNRSSIPNSDDNDATHLWSELSPSCEPAEILIAGPDLASGTFEFFREEILVDYKESETFRAGYFDSDDDQVLVDYVETNGTVIGYFGFAYYIQEGELLYAAPIENYAGQFIAPTEESVTNATYFPLSRRLFMNLLDDPKSLKNTAPFIEFGMSEAGAQLVRDTGYVPIPEALSELMVRRVQGDQAQPTTSNGGPASTSTNGESGNAMSSSLTSHCHFGAALVVVASLWFNLVALL